MKLRRPRFSLRTLIVVVLGIALCWTLTATWGISTVFDTYPTLYQKERNGNSMRFVNVVRGEDIVPDKDMIVSGTAISPFFIRIITHEANANWEVTSTYFWFFGYQCLIGTREQTHSK
jgi:hypothetical protein